MIKLFLYYKYLFSYILFLVMDRGVTTIIFDLSEVLLKGLLGIEKRLKTPLQLPEEKIYRQMHNDKLTKLFLGNTIEMEYLK